MKRKELLTEDTDIRYEPPEYRYDREKKKAKHRESEENFTVRLGSHTHKNNTQVQ